MTSKPWYRSLTFWSLIATLFGLVLAGVGQGAPLIDILGDPAVQGTIGEILAALGLGGTLYGRARAQGPMTLGGRPEERGNVRLGAMLVIGAVAMMFIVLTFAGGCGPRNLVLDPDDPPPTFAVKRGPPCRMSLVALGEEQAVVTHGTARCRLVVDGVEVP